MQTSKVHKRPLLWRRDCMAHHLYRWSAAWRDWALRASPWPPGDFRDPLPNAPDRLCRGQERRRVLGQAALPQAGLQADHGEHGTQRMVRISPLLNLKIAYRQCGHIFLKIRSKLTLLFTLSDVFAYLKINKNIENVVREWSQIFLNTKKIWNDSWEYENKKGTICCWCHLHRSYGLALGNCQNSFLKIICPDMRPLTVCNVKDKLETIKHGNQNVKSYFIQVGRHRPVCFVWSDHQIQQRSERLRLRLRRSPRVFEWARFANEYNPLQVRRVHIHSFWVIRVTRNQLN